MTDSNALVEKFHTAYKADETVRERMEADPRGTLAEYGIELPEGAKCEFVGGDDMVRITMPEGALDDAQLASVSGGTNATASVAVFVGLAGLITAAATTAAAAAGASGSS